MHPSTTASQAEPDRKPAERRGLGMSVSVAGPDYEGHVVIDTLVEDRSAGGVRIAADLPLAEVGELAQEMSLKYALFLLPRGGAKAGVRLPAGMSQEQKIAALEDFGRRLTPLIGNGIYSPGMDMNCGPEELRAIYRGAGISLGRITDTSWYTALSVYHSVCAVADRLGIEGRPVRLSIEGFGSVATHLAERLDAAQFEIVSVATIEGAVRGLAGFAPADLAQARAAKGDAFVNELDGEPVSRDETLTDEVDIVLPSSRIHAITGEVAREFRARAVVPIANAPYAPGALDLLSPKVSILLPGYLTNCGGVLASSLADQGLPLNEVEELFASRYRSIVDGILAVAASGGHTGVQVTEALARGHMPEREVRVWRSVPRRVYDRFLKPRRPAGLKTAEARKRFTQSADRVLAEISDMETSA